ncbi:hypothetical protein FisN_23Lh063 [Fistulifera solaris]|uniref:Uncharacterized protein n=1 Tax=Fistulifera solaris TaxID=1519565 RepID=A0A1Z5KK07_FISSO|nr:hypothetical protein FisN_23Lh063 [Fistulifera solaris]|eukprot:GAX26537.1 hypothetical protein FisN_23Lh063 [Fistulifera solaris]
MIRAGTIQEPFESSRELSRRYRVRRCGYGPQRARWGHGHNQHFIFSNAYISEDASFHSGLPAISKKVPFSSQWKYRKLSGDDTVSLINSSIESDDMVWSGMLTNHHRFLPALDLYDNANKQGKMAKMWSLACLLNCPRQKRVPATSFPPEMYHQDRSLSMCNVSASRSFDDEPSRIESSSHFDFEALELQPQIATFNSTISLFESYVFETSMYSDDLFPESDEHFPNSGNSSQCSVSEVVKEQHEFAQMLEFWRKQAQETVEKHGRNEKMADEVMEDKEHPWDRIAGGEISIGRTHHQRVVVKEFTSSTLPADITTCCEQVRRPLSLDHTQPSSSMNGDHKNMAACEQAAETQNTNDATFGRIAVLSACDNVTLENSVGEMKTVNAIACVQPLLTSNAMSVAKTGHVAESTVACNNPGDDNGQNKENSTELDRDLICKRSRSHIENLIMFWNKSEPKRLGKARGSVSNEEAKDEKRPFPCTSNFQTELLSRLTAGRIQSGHRHGHTSPSTLHEEDWISRLTVSRTRQSEHSPKSACSETTSTARQVPALTQSLESDSQQKEQLQKAPLEEEAMMFWSPRLFDHSNASESSSVSTIHREAYSLSSGKSDSTVSWFGMVGMDAVSDDSSLRRRLKNYKAENDPEDADFDESRQRISPPLMLEDIDNLVTQLSKDYVDALSGLEVTR